MTFQPTSNQNLLLEGYTTGRRELVYVNSIAYEIQYFQGEHENEYLITQLKNGKPNGRCQLFKDGILEQSWMQEDGQYIGGFTVYDEGKAVYYQQWANAFGLKEIRTIENDKNNLMLVIRDSNTCEVLYRGEFRKEDMTREGKGIEYDGKGNPLHYGVFHNDTLFQILQRFEKDVMVTYAVEEGVSNLHLKDRHPVYRGGFLFDETTSLFLPHGQGRAFDPSSGMMISEGVWEKGDAKEQQALHGGWYAAGMEEPCLLALIHASAADVDAPAEQVQEQEQEAEECSFSIHDTRWQLDHLPAQLTELCVDAGTCNEPTIKALTLTGLSQLQHLRIGENCFRCVARAELRGLPRLEDVAVGVNSFTESPNNCGKREKTLTVVECPCLATLDLGDFAFSDYTHFALSRGRC